MPTAGCRWSTAAGAKRGLLPADRARMVSIASRERRIPPPTNEEMLGAAPITMPPRPAVSMMALSPMSPAASAAE